jgi:hypothetical protein
VLARFYSSSGDAQVTTRCVVPARMLPASVAFPHEGLMLGCPSVWQNPVAVHLFDLVRDKEEAGNRIVIDVDDPYHLLSEGWKQKDVDSHLDALKVADVLLCTTEALAESYSGLHDDIRVIPSCVAVEDFQLGRQAQHLDGKFRIGYAAGYTHGPDADLLTEALARIADHPDVVVEFVGAFDPGWDFPYRRYPALPYPAYKSMLATWNVGLAPLVDNDLNRTRSDLKALDYAMSGAACVATPTGPYAHLAERGVIAAAETPQEWYDALYALVTSTEACAHFVGAAYDYCRVERHPANQRTAYVDALGLRRSYTHA